MFGQSNYEDRRIENIGITFEGNDRGVSAAQQFELIVRSTLGDKYSAVKIRDAIDALYKTQRIVSAKVEATSSSGDAGVNLRFVIKRKTQAEKVNIIVGNVVGDKVTEQELLLKLNLLNSGTSVTEKTLQDNADLILVYLRERGFFNSQVTYTQQPLKSETEVAVTFQVNPNEQAKVEKFTLNIEGFNPAKVLPKLKLQTGELYSREVLAEDVETIRKALRDDEKKFLAPNLEDARVVLDADKNVVSIDLTGKVGATVDVVVDAGKEKVGDKKQTELLSIKREGTLDYASIIEGARRLRNYFQEQGYFFADVTPVCSVRPEFTAEESSVTTNESESLCSSLSGAELMDRTVEVKYKVNLSRQLKLVDIRIEGTDKFTTEDIKSTLESQEANALGFIPFFGYGRGYTSNEILDEDRVTIESLLRELGYRRNKVTVRQGVSPNGEDLIITFIVDEGIPTRISDVAIEGNTSFNAASLEAKLPSLIGKNFSRARARNGVRELSTFYSNAGFYDAKVTYSIVELGKDTATGEELIKLVYTLENEGKKVFINRVLINGNEMTKNDAILRAINLRVDNTLRQTDIFTSEQNLYATDAFDSVEIKVEPAGERADGNRLSDILINIDEKAPRLITYGGGFSTDFGANGFFDIRHFNLFGKLQQGGARVRISRLQQLVQIDFINPRFVKDGKNADNTTRYAPLTFTAQYQRDSTVTRFFRSTFDSGTFGIVQRIDEDGNPIDEFGATTSDPTINRLTFSAETSRTISRKNRSILFARYKFEDVRLFNFESLLVKDLLRPDARIRTSGFGANFVFDTRQDCSIKYTILDIIAKGDAGEPCRYSATNPTRGMYLTADYNVSVPFLGANIGFQKFQGTYNQYYTSSLLRNTTFAGRAIVGLASVFSSRNRFPAQFSDLEGTLPISERFFAGGSTTIRGFDFEQAGPRVVIVPQGFFRNSDGDQVFLSPFSVPFGGNALVIVNLEARIPLTESIRAVPFYDGGNVFKNVSDIFKRPEVAANDVLRQNLRSIWSNTVGLGFRVKTPIGGEFGVDYGYLLNPPQFLIPQPDGSNAIFRVKQGQLHFRFSQAF